MEPFPLSWVVKTLNADVLNSSSRSLERQITGICTDSRKIQHGNLFFALVGENSDGHQYVAQALAKGAAAAVVSHCVESADGLQIVVPNALVALGDLAQAYRRRFHIPVIGITGSVGKTSTREMIAAVLRTKLNTLSSEKNYNNEIGVPLTLFQLTRQHEAAVIEMGMRGLGEIDRLAEIAEPTIGVITNIGYAHIEWLGSREAIAQAKSELLARLPAGGTAILPYHDEFFEYMKARVAPGCQIVTFTDYALKGWTADVSICKGRGTRYRLRIRDSEYHRVELNAVGTHHARNAAAALAVAHVMSVPIQPAAEALSKWQGAEGRMQVRNTHFGYTVLDDCYNAGPESMASALETLDRMRSGAIVAVLGSIKEVGDFSDELHRKVGLDVAKTAPNVLITVGEEARIIAETAKETLGPNRADAVRMVHYADTETAAAHIREWIQPGDTVLVKGSRAMEMEKIVAVLTGETGAGAHG